MLDGPNHVFAAFNADWLAMQLERAVPDSTTLSAIRDTIESRYVCVSDAFLFYSALGGAHASTMSEHVFRWLLLRVGLASGESSPVFRSFHGAALLLERVAALRARRMSSSRGSISQLQAHSQRRSSGASINSGSTAAAAAAPPGGATTPTATAAAAAAAAAAGQDRDPKRGFFQGRTETTAAALGPRPGAAHGLGRARFTEALVTASLVKSGGRLQLVSTAAAGLREVLDDGLLPALRADAGPAMPGSMPLADAFRRDVALLRPVETELFRSIPTLIRLLEAAELASALASAPRAAGRSHGAASRSARLPGGADGSSAPRPGLPAVTMAGWVRFLRGCGMFRAQDRRWGMTVSEAKWHFVSVQSPSLDTSPPEDEDDDAPAPAQGALNGTGFAEALVRLAASPGSWHLTPVRALRVDREINASSPTTEDASSDGGRPSEEAGLAAAQPAEGSQTSAGADCADSITPVAAPVAAQAHGGSLRALATLSLAERVMWLLRVLEHSVRHGQAHWQLVSAAAADEAAAEVYARRRELPAAWMSLFHATEAFRRCETELAERSPGHAGFQLAPIA
ncbi:hypothetical protein FNF31_03958 [Cafeteria roenbergensis]|uniref:Uncharacterized protein n=1 Tax=Cafeteria roenbergensis TaxID=33653 RepID=A0A5A8D8Y2_CAFRO|nr:hypothetical protein FNF31_03958 [Cafeteria roenbergensis]